MTGPTRRNPWLRPVPLGRAVCRRRAAYLWWQAQDRRVVRRINQLITDVMRNGNEGIGKPEPLKHDFAGYWSRRITDEHRLVYKAADGEVRVAACRYHYGR